MRIIHRPHMPPVLVHNDVYQEVMHGTPDCGCPPDPLPAPTTTGFGIGAAVDFKSILIGAAIGALITYLVMKIR